MEDQVLHDSLRAADPLARLEPGIATRVADPITGEVDHALLRALDTVRLHSHVFQPKFYAWLAENWQLWRRFDAEAQTIWLSGRPRYSARTIIEFLRHQTYIRESSVTASVGPGGGAFKINNSFVPDIGRLYGLLNPTRADFFECRELHAPTVRRAIRGGGARPGDGEAAHAA